MKYRSRFDRQQRLLNRCHKLLVVICNQRDVLTAMALAKEQDIDLTALYEKSAQHYRSSKRLIIDIKRELKR